MDLDYSLEKILLRLKLAIHLTINQTIKCNIKSKRRERENTDIYSSSPLFVLAKGYVYSSR